MAEKREYDVIIIGAGIAGVSAAKALSLNGWKNFLVLEGSL